jgi:hypothetical protein
VSTIIATAHQALRYFVGAIAALFVAVPPGEAWSRRFLSSLALFTDAKNPTAVLAVLAVTILIAGSLIYGAHRVVVYPVIFRVILGTVLGRGSTTKRRFLWPYGTAVASEMELEELGSRLEGRHHERFVGWASEVHLCYLATEIALFTLCIWPGWPRVTCPWAWRLGLLVVALPLVAAWDLQAVSVLVHRARNPVSVPK